MAADGVITRIYPATVDVGPEDQGLMLIDVQVTKMLKGEAVPTVTVLFDWATTNPTPVDAVAAGLPAGTRVLVFGDPSSWPRPDAAPRESSVMETAAEGLIVETSPDSFEVAWGDQPTGKGWQGIDTMDELSDSLGVARAG